ncbi:MAG: hypothetical protein WCE94_05000 [Candidatus Methanoperedens sp.]
MSLFDDVCRVVDGWSPHKSYLKESLYRDEFIELLRSKLNKRDWFGEQERHFIEKETGRHLADISVDGKIGIEFKLNLKTKAEADRLVGQVKGFLLDYKKVVIVLCGKTDRDKVEYLMSLLKEYTESDMLDFLNEDMKIKIFTK